jgi:broad specificity phosphatase PhoE
MKLLLIRHGETVDNVAGVYAGTRDSKLTNHGVEQTTRLGQYFARTGVRFTHLFSSPLSRALKTAEAVQKAHNLISGYPKDGSSRPVEIVKAKELMERDFGFYEGKPFNTRARDGEDDKNRYQPGFVEVESKESMAKRIDSFLEKQLLPLLDDGETAGSVVAIVAHGMLLSHLWRRLLLRFPAESLTLTPEVTIKKQGTVLEYIGGWSNTGYMELLFEKSEQTSSRTPVDNNNPAATEDDAVVATATTTLQTPVPPALASEEAEIAVVPDHEKEPKMSSTKPCILSGWNTTILAVDNTLHLLGLKRQRGGIGSLAHDEGQRTLDSFFKKPRLT